MRKVHIELTAKVPAWHFCNLDKTTRSLKVSSELCRFCHQTKDGYRCSLYNVWLTSDRRLVDKADRCIKDTMQRSAEVVDEDVPQIDPALIISETLKSYKKTLNSLLAQGYPRNLAEAIAEKFTLGEDE